MVSCIPKAKCSRDYYLTEFFLYLNLDCFSLTWVLYSILLWHLHLTIEFFKDPPFLLIYEMIESDKPMYLSLWHQTFKKVKEELPWESQSLKNNFDMEAEFMSASPTHSSVNSCLSLERVGIVAFCCTSKKIRVQTHRLTVLSVSSYYPWIKKPSCASLCLKTVSSKGASQSWSFLGHHNWRRHNRACCGRLPLHVREALILSLGVAWGFINSCLHSAKY